MSGPRPDARGGMPAAARPVSRLDALMLGLSGSGPAQTLAVTLAALVAASGYGGALPVLVCFLPMLGIAVAYQRLNRWDPRSGATYTWVARTFHPYLGFLAGWMILLYYTLGTSSLTIPAGTYTLELFAPALVDDPRAVAVAGGAWNVAVTLLAVRGLKLAARFEGAIVVFQYAVLICVSIAGLAALARGAAAAAFSWSWFTLTGLGGLRGLMSGLLIACFMYSGWDAAIYVNEESVERGRHPGQAAIASVAILAVFYAVCVLGLQAAVPTGTLAAHAGNALAVIAPTLLGAPWGTLVSLAVLTGTLATLQAAVISAARVGHAMARDRVLPALLGRVDPRSGNPRAAALLMGLINLALLALALSTGSIGRALNTVVGGLGLIAITFYGLTGAAAFWHGRATLRRSWRDFVLGGVLPAGGTLFMLWVAVESVRTGATTDAALAYGAGSLALGLGVAVAVARWGATDFFRAPRLAPAHPRPGGTPP